MTIKRCPLKKKLGKGEMLLNSIFFFSMKVFFFTQPKVNFITSVTFDLTSANAFNFVDSFESKAILNIISVVMQQPVNLSMLPWMFLRSALHNILQKPLAAFPYNHCRNNEGGINPYKINVINPYHHGGLVVRVSAGHGFDPWL